VTEIEINCHYIMKKNTLRVVIYFFLFFVHLIKNSINFLLDIKLLGRIFEIFSIFALSDGKFVRF
jgi:hypothetical protein